MSWKQKLKAPLRPIVSPLLRRFEARVDIRTHQRLAEIDAALTVIRAQASRSR